MRNKGGAPKGGRVHFFNLWLPKIIRENYHISFRYEKHCYFLQRTLYGRKHCEYYTIIRTSEHCIRVSYYDAISGMFEYTSYRSFNDVIDYMLYRIVHRLREEDELAKRNKLEEPKK